MIFQTLNIRPSVLACSILLASTGLVACGGSDGDGSSANNNNNNGTPTQPSVDESLTKDEQAKEIINTARTFVTDADAVQQVYDSADEILSETQQERLSYAMDIADHLNEYMLDNNKQTLTKAEVMTALVIEYGEDAYTAIPSDDFTVMLDDSDVLTMSGMLEVTHQPYYEQWNPQTGGYDYIAGEKDVYDVVYDNFEYDLTDIKNQKSVDANVGFDKLTIGSGDELLTLTANTESAKLLGSFSKNLQAGDELDLEAEHLQGNAIEMATIQLSDVTLTANNNTLKADNLEVKLLDIAGTDSEGIQTYRSVPYQLALSGQLQQQSPQTDVMLTLNASASDDDVKDILLLSNGNIEEREGKYLPLTVVLAIKGDVTKEQGVVIPLDLQATLKRDAKEQIILEGLTAQVDDKTLYATGTATLNDDREITSTTITFKQNDARITINLDGEGDLIADADGKIADILVDGEDYGDLYDYSSGITAKFNDNSLIVL